MSPDAAPSQGRIQWSKIPSAPPPQPPMTIDGPKTPPEPPLPIVRPVVRILPNAISDSTSASPRLAWCSAGSVIASCKLP